MEPVGVATITPSPMIRWTMVWSAQTSTSATRAIEPLENTASLRARSWLTGRPPRNTCTSSIIRSSVTKCPWARGTSRESSVRSSSAIKPTLPMFTPRMGTPWRVASRAAWRMVPSPPKQTNRSARGSSSSSWRRERFRGKSSRSPFRGTKGRHSTVSAPAFRKIRSASRAVRSPLSRYGLELKMILMPCPPCPARGRPPPAPSGRRRRPAPAGWTGSPGTQYCPPARG